MKVVKRNGQETNAWHNHNMVREILIKKITWLEKEYSLWKPKVKAKSKNKCPQWLTRVYILFYDLFVHSRVKGIFVILQLLGMGHSYGPWVFIFDKYNFNN